MVNEEKSNSMYKDKLSWCIFSLLVFNLGINILLSNQLINSVILEMPEVIFLILFGIPGAMHLLSEEKHQRKKLAMILLKVIAIIFLSVNLILNLNTQAVFSSFGFL